MKATPTRLIGRRSNLSKRLARAVESMPSEIPFDDDAGAAAAQVYALAWAQRPLQLQALAAMGGRVAVAAAFVLMLVASCVDPLRDAVVNARSEAVVMRETKLPSAS